MDSQKKQVVDKLKEAKNVLVTVSADPSVDQLAACLGLTLALNKAGKHAAAVFSGEVPSTIEFLKPEETLEQNTDSLRDFIIALDRAKADKLRYKVEDKVVKIFITPYKTSISQDDLEFSEGDFNVDVVVALGVKDQQDIDQAVMAHGNILHDATVITLSTSDESGLGSIHWRDPAASGVSELAASLTTELAENLLDEQIATAFLTGIVACTERFSNNLTSSQTMTVAAGLMSAGANQQLVATKLEEAAPAPESVSGQAELPEPVEEPEAEGKAEEPIDQTAEPVDPDTLHIDHHEPTPEKKEAGSGLNGLPPLDQLLPKPEDKPGQEAKVLPPAPEPSDSGTTSPDEQPAGTSKKETIDDIEASVHSPHHEVTGDDLSGTPDDSEPKIAPLPSIHVDENGQLIHHPNEADLKPAPGFEAGGQPADEGHHLLGMSPQEDGRNSDDNPPPVPPPIV